MAAAAAAAATAAPPPPLPPRDASGRAHAMTTAAEVEELRRLVQRERQLLEEERQRALQRTPHIESAIHQVQELEKKTLEVMKAVGVERTHLFRAEFRLEAHRIHLLQQLRLIFPIKVIPVDSPAQYPQHHYTISGVPLPYDVHDLAITDEQVSTALGFLCHFVALTSKYLAVPLRYGIVCKWSRSAILFDECGRHRRGHGAAEHSSHAAARVSSSKVVYPLFRERGVIAPEQLGYGWTLLERDVDCLLRTRRVDGRPEWHALAKMDRLLTWAIEGQDPHFRGNAG